MSRTSISCLALMFLLVGPESPALAQEAGTRSPLALGAGGRTLAMGRTGVASVDASTAVFWNPARLAATTRGDVSLFHTKLFVDGMSYQAGFVSYPTVEAGAFGLGIQRLSSGDIDVRDDRNTLLSSTSFSETNFLLGYGIRFRERWSVGTTVRLAQQSAAGMNALGVGADLAGAVEGRFGDTAHGWRMGANVQNLIEPNLQLDEEEVADPISLKFGGAYLHDDPNRRFHWMLAADLDQTREAGMRTGVGVEIGFDRLLFLRGGADDGRLTAGFGVQYKGVVIDYAMIDDPDLPRNDRLSLGLRFGPSTDDRIATREAQREQEVARELEQRLGARERDAYQTALREADSAFRARDYAGALVLYRRVLLLRPDDVTATRQIDESSRLLAHQDARNSLDAGRLAAAMTAYQSLLETWPHDAEAAQMLKDARQRLAETTDREQQIDDLVRLALSQFTSEDFAAARRTLGEIRRLDRKNPIVEELSARVESVRVKRGQEALEAADAFAVEGAYAAAIQQLGTAERLWPERSDEIQVRRAQWQAARDAAGEPAVAPVVATPRPSDTQRPAPSAERQRELEAEFQQGLKAFQEGNFERATGFWRIVWSEWPQHPNVGSYLVKAHLFEGIRLVGDGRYNEALVQCERVLDIDPGNEKALRYVENISTEQEALRNLGSVAR